MSDSEVMAEMKKMVMFIKQEAMEKAREIKVKADEEFAIEKGKIVRQETINIDAQYEKKHKQAGIEKKIAQSTQTNKARLQILETREQLLDEVFEAARSKVANIQQDEVKYSEFLQNLILQGLYTIMEKDIKVVCRPKDGDKAKKAVQQASSTFSEKSGLKDVKVEVIEDLSDESNGGVSLVGYNNRITVENTLDERLRLLEETMLPAIRTALFGANPNRKFYT